MPCLRAKGMCCIYSFCMGNLAEVLLVLAAALAWITLTLTVIILPAARLRNSRTMPVESSSPVVAADERTSTAQAVVQEARRTQTTL